MYTQIPHNNTKLMEYRKGVQHFENYLKKMYSPENRTNSHCGYLINLKDYEKIKKLIKYDKFQENIIDFDEEDFNKTFEIKQIDFKTSEYLLNMVYNDNEYIIIDTELWKIICQKGRENEKPIIYTVNPTILILNMEDKEIWFNHNKK